jgi:hypothetical protein
MNTFWSEINKQRHVSASAIVGGGLLVVGMIELSLCRRIYDERTVEFTVFVVSLFVIAALVAYSVSLKSGFDWPRVARTLRVVPPDPVAHRGPPAIVGLSGRSGAGKDCVADILVRRAGFVKLSYAHPLKCAVQFIFGFSDEQLWGPSRNVVDPFWGIAPRRVLQAVGTELFREKFGELFPEIGRNVWIRAMQHQIAQHPGRDIVIADVRFENELEPLGTAGASWCIHRPSQDSSLAGASAAHASETQKFRIDKTIQNDGTLQDLERVTMQALEDHLGK